MSLKHLSSAAFVAAALLVAGCSSPDPYEPAELEKVRTLVQAQTVWNVSVSESLTGLLTPAVTQDGVYVAGENELTRINGTDGKKLWTVKTEGDVIAGVGADESTIALGNDKGELEVFDPDGKRRWKTKLSSEMTVPPLVGSGLVIVTTSDTRITAFDAISGERRWRYQSQVPALTVRAPSTMKFSPAGILAGQSNGRLLALDGQGRVVFEALVAQPKGITEVERLTDVVGTPLVNAKMMCAAAFQGGILCLDATNGQRLWSAQVDAVTGPVSDGNHVFVVTARGEINAYDAQTGKLVWSNNALLWRAPSAVVPMDNVIAVGDYDGVIHLLNPATGEIIGRTTISGAVRAAPVPFAHGALFQTDKGSVAYVRIKP